MIATTTVIGQEEKRLVSRCNRQLRRAGFPAVRVWVGEFGAVGNRSCKFYAAGEVESEDRACAALDLAGRIIRDVASQVTHVSDDPWNRTLAASIFKPSAFADFVSLCDDRLRHYFSRRLKVATDHIDVDALMSTTLADVFEHRGKLELSRPGVKDGRGARSFLFIKAANAWSAFLNGGGRFVGAQIVRGRTDDEDCDAGDPLAAMARIDGDEADSDLDADVRLAVSRLCPECQSLYELRIVQGATFREAAPVGYQRLCNLWNYQCLPKLRKLLRDWEYAKS